MRKNAIVFDYSNLCHRCLHLKQVAADSARPAWALMEYMIFEAMVEFVCQIAEEDTDIILAMDSPGDYWRRNYYHLYKADRSARREASGIDYKTAFQHFNRLASDIQRFFPWKVIQVPRCEADDVIYAVTQMYEGSVVIHSSDSDYIQLVSDNVRLYRAHEDEWFSFPYKGIRDARTFLEVAILTGQSGKDNVYNVRTPTHWTPEDGRKPGLGLKSALKYIDAGVEKTLKEKGLWHNYVRNELIIDMAYIPQDLLKSIQAEISSDKPSLNDFRAFFAYKDWPSYTLGDVRAEMTIELLSYIAGIQYTELEEQVTDVDDDPEEILDFTF